MVQGCLPYHCPCTASSARGSATLKIAFFTLLSPAVWYLQATSPSEPWVCMPCSSAWHGKVLLHSLWHGPAAARCSSMSQCNSLIQQKTNPAGNRWIFLWFSELEQLGW